ncbi:TIGR04211 family SH3 domain-containing protein [Kaarinaea lacus]
MSNYRRIILLITLLLSMATSTVWAETTFITDKVTVEVFSSTHQRGTIVATVTSGAVVEVLETDGDYTKIRTADNQEGWLHSKFLTTEKPTQVSYMQLMAKYKTLEEQLNQAQAKIQTTGSNDKQRITIDKLRNDLATTNKQIKQLEKTLKEKTAQLEKSQQELATLKQQSATGEDKTEAVDAATKVPAATPAAEVAPAVSEVSVAPVRPMKKKPAFGLDYPIELKWVLIALLLSLLAGIYSGHHWLDAKIRKRHGGVRIR